MFITSIPLFVWLFSLNCCKAFLNVFDNVLDIFKTNREPYHSAVYPTGNELLISELSVCCGSRMKNTGADISNVDFV